jgi:hypothetical protein
MTGFSARAVLPITISKSVCCEAESIKKNGFATRHTGYKPERAEVFRSKKRFRFTTHALQKRASKQII